MQLDTLFEAAIESLSRDKLRIINAPFVVPPKPGLHAIYGNASAWKTLGASATVNDGPL